MSLSRILTITLITLILLPSLLLADSEPGSISGIGILFSGLILVVVFVCFFLAMKVFSLLRGGELASGWQMLAISFIVLCLGQLVELASTLELFNLDQAIVVTLRLAGVFLLLLGIVRIKKVLS